MYQYLIPFFNPGVNDWASQARLLRWLTLLWLLIGLVVLFSASYPVANERFDNGLHYFTRQLIWAYLGLVLFNLVTATPLKRLLKATPYIMLGLSILVILTKFIGIEIHGATRWIKIGPLLLQPSELIKPFLVLQSATVFATWNRLSNSQRYFWLIIFALTLGGILIQPSLGNTALIGISLWLIAFMGMIRLKYLGWVALGGLGLAATSIGLREYQWKRLTSFLETWKSVEAGSYQLTQSLIAIGSGGSWGTGWGLSQQKLFYLPIQYTDFIFAVFAEEFGFFGCMVLLLLIVSWATIALLVAYRAQKTVNRLIVVGAINFLIGQSLINIGVATASLPTTGLPLPLISYGGNSLLASLILAALVIRVARENKEGSVVEFNHRSH